jgi:flagellar motor switch protein FliN/FliY
MHNDVDNKEPTDLTSSDKNEEGPESPAFETNLEKAQNMPADSGKIAKENTYAFSDLDKAFTREPPDNIEFILDIPLEVSVELGRTKMLVSELLKLGQGSIIGLSKLAGETLEVLANQKLIARGEVVVLDEKYGIRLTEIASPTERIEGLK